MGIAEIIALAAGALNFGQSLIPRIRDMIESGEVSEYDQAAARAAYDSLRKQAGGQWEGPEWELSGR